IRQLLEGMPAAPPYFLQMKRVNSQGPKVLTADGPTQQRLTPQQFQTATSQNGLILDLRSKEAFAAAHIPRAVNIPLGQNTSTWAGWVLPYNQPLYLVLEEKGQWQEAITQLIRVGFDEIAGILEGGMEAWENASLPVSRLAVQTVQELHQQLKKHAGEITVLDVRTPGEWQSGHIEGAQRIHAGLLGKNLARLNRHQPVAVVCGTGYRASIASSILLREGFTQVTNVLGGMSAWNAAELPTVKSVITET
ncbi:MAG TPA: rhodanese-like domain-containing protein, partial [Gemmatales bacterium]|nr:rhodanese-like domain-containing protein [Gemmatales bacterium]